MIKQLIKAIKAVQEQYTLQNRLNVLIDNPRAKSVKVRIPKVYIEIIEVLAEYGITDPEVLRLFIDYFIKNKSKRVIENLAIAARDCAISLQDFGMSFKAINERLMKEIIENKKS